MNDDRSNKIKEILTDWNPLGEKSTQILDLNNYETEADDILFNIEMDFEHKQISNKRYAVKNIVKEVLNEAFNIFLTDKDCEKPAELIYQIIIE